MGKYLECADCGRLIDIENEDYITLENGDVVCADCMDNYIQCDECGEWISKDDAIWVYNYDGDYVAVCENCLDDFYVECVDCGRYIHQDNAIWVHTSYRDTEPVCEDCLDNYYQCDDCGEWWDSDYIHEAINSDGYRINICDTCAENYYYCENCDRLVHEDFWDFDHDCCCDCAPDRDGRIWDYHDRPRMHYFGNIPKNWKNWHGIGIELEVDDGEYQSEALDGIQKAIGEDFVYFNHDGSLDENGFEIISQPSTYEYFKKQNWEGVLEACKENGYKSHDTTTCGLHVHLSREYFGNTQEERDRAITKLVLFYNYFYDDILAISRRKYGEAHDWARKYDADYGDLSIKEANDVAKSKNHSRYHAVNLTNNNTIEIRIMKGTLNYKSFMACIDFIVKTAIKSKTISYKNIHDFSKWIENVDDNTKEYIKQRGIHVNEEVM